ncbi:tyrosine-type recombinase/integrase [Bacillus massilinigeriensis]|uniref:tyrosine-type recombinase/integrase n=1 Tax=Bacillus mediterraneensis TaxID=1805474 RepID=UPI0024AFAAF8|nr:tyrosine-type recombinase/integrase [Bacillus mediterraneensis]
MGKKQKEELLISGYNSLQPEQLIFSNKNNDYIQPSKTSQWISKLQNKYSIPKVSTHGLRHTHCTLLFEAGATIKEVQDRLGQFRCTNNFEYLRSGFKKCKRRSCVKIRQLSKFLTTILTTTR